MLHFKNNLRLFSFALLCLFINVTIFGQTNNYRLKIIIIRHGEKPAKGNNLNCQGLNRAQLLPAVITSKFGVPAFCYVPSLSSDSATAHARMFQTITPLAVRYNLVINSKYSNKDSAGLTTDILKRTGNVLVVWSHTSILPIIHALGINIASLKWEDDDFDSIWIITFENGKAVLTKDKENLRPAADCK